MSQPVQVGIIGDFNLHSLHHLATNAALQHAAAALSTEVECTWVPTESLEPSGSGKALDRFEGLWCAPGSPYVSMDGALNGIRFARERGKPFVGT